MSNHTQSIIDVSQATNTPPSLVPITQRRLMLQTFLAPLILYFIPTITVIGIAGNTFAFVSTLVLRLYNKSPVFVFFLYISGLDLIFVLTECIIPLAFSVYTDLYIKYDLHIVCQLHIFIVTSTQLSSSWILVVAQAYRLYGLARPFKISPHSNARTMVAFCTVFTSFSFLASSYVFWTTKLNKNPVGRYLVTACFFDLVNYPIFKTLYVTSLLATYCIVPGCLMLLLSLGIIWTLASSYRTHKELMKNSNENETTVRSSTFEAARNSAMMLLPLAVVHIVFTIPTATAGLMPKSPTVRSVFTICKSLWVVNHSINFYVSLIFSEFYRKSLLPYLYRSRKNAK